MLTYAVVCSGVKRWYSVPLTNEEVLLSDKEVLTLLALLVQTYEYCHLRSSGQLVLTIQRNFFESFFFILKNSSKKKVQKYEY